MFVAMKVLGAVVLGAIMMVPALAQAALPVEIGVELLAKDMTAAEAGKLLREDAKSSRTSAKEGRKAVEVLEALIEKGVPVTTAYGAVSAAVKRGEKTEALAGDKNVAALKKEAARGDVDEAAKAEGLKAQDVAVAVEVLEGLIERGVPVEKARDVVKEAISQDRDPQRLREMLTAEHVERIKAEAVRGKPGDEAIGEKMRIRHTEKVGEKIRKRPNTPTDGGGFRR